MVIQTIALFTTLLVAAGGSNWEPSSHHTYGLTQPMPRIPGTVRIATYNLLNFFDDDVNHEPALAPRDATTSYELSDIIGSNGKQIPHTSDARRKELAKVIQAVDADILLLQEVESKEVLAAFNDNELAELGCKYAYIASEDVGYYRGIEQSILSRFPISDIKTWPNANLDSINPEGIGWSDVPKNLSFQRSPLCATVTIPANSNLELKKDYKITFFVVHHKAGNNAGHREREGLQIVEYIKALEKNNPEMNIVVAGDFNAQSHYKSVRSTYLAIDMHDPMKHRASNIEYDPDAPLWKTHVSNRSIDFLLFNNNAHEEIVLNSGFILGTSSQQYDWRNSTPPQGIASDHFPVVMDIVPIEGGGDVAIAPAWPSKVVNESLALHKKNSNAKQSTKTTSKPKNANYKQTDALIISGIFDGPLKGGKPKLIELTALQDIPDLSMYSLARFVNGSDKGKNSFSLEPVTIKKGDAVFITSDIAPATEYFGFTPDYIYKSGVANNNGDDAISLYENGEMIDVFGVIGEDGSKTSWEYTDGWAYRKSGSTPSGNVFANDDWTVSGKDVNDNNLTNSEAGTPFPIQSFTTN